MGPRVSSYQHLPSKHSRNGALSRVTACHYWCVCDHALVYVFLMTVLLVKMHLAFIHFDIRSNRHYLGWFIVLPNQLTLEMIRAFRMGLNVLFEFQKWIQIHIRRKIRVRRTGQTLHTCITNTVGKHNLTLSYIAMWRQRSGPSWLIASSASNDYLKYSQAIVY